ncbi:YggT family protein [Catenuloplanes nepalensis]|uniref:YggT family protein n=1 Tax=Catenuloplanes nepalensis TaxID=587533 RepID=A0ABT9MYK9_9ACTN|nr:YggT family protein [Catenuloplanes nepalensis]MDP9796474.1 YggT family protein [Catenuloplanes nepalensis]
MLALISTVLLLFQFLLIARALLDWSTVLAGPSMPGSFRDRAIRVVHTVTEPVLAPVRKILPPVRFGAVGIDLSFIVVFAVVVLLQAII